LELSRVPFNVIDHEVPGGRPTSVNVTGYSTWEKIKVGSASDVPLTVNDPE
jgi:hypothetical protein